MNIPLTIEGLQKGYNEKEFSIEEVVKEYLRRIKEHDKDINSFITVSEEYALNKAQQADKQLTKEGSQIFKNKPLLGTVVALKDMFLTKGIRTTAGSKVLENYIPHYSGTAVKKLESAGAIIIGKTNQDAWAHGASGENSDFGNTKNPWNPGYVPGGSSSGSAAAVSANFCTFSMGTDTGGSVRQPAAFNSIVGLKPTYGAVSRYGVVAMASSLDTISHSTRSVKDAETVLEVTKGKDGKDATLKELELKDEDPKEITIGLPKEYYTDAVDRAVLESVNNAVEVYKKAGLKIKEVSLPHTKYAISIYYIVMPAEVSSNLGRYDGIRYGNNRQSFAAEAKRRIMLGTYVLSVGYYDAYYLKAQKVRTKLIQELEDVFKQVDVLMTPVSPFPPFRLGEKALDPIQMYLADVFTVSANITGTPGLAIPSGFTDNNLPLGFQLMGPRFSESRLISLGKLYEQESGQKPQAAIK